MGRPRKPFPPQPKVLRGQVRVWWNGRWNHLGPESDPAAWKAEFARLVALWKDDPNAGPLDPGELLVPTLFRHFLESADSPPEGKRRDRVARVYELLKAHHLQTPAADFGPNEFRAWQRWLCGLPHPKHPDRTRFNATSIRDFRGVVKAVWKWAVSTDRLTPDRLAALKAVPPPRVGEAREPKVVTPADPATVDKVVPKLPPAFRAVVTLLRLSAARPTEILTLRPSDVERSGDVWVYRPRKHKGTWRRKPRVIRFGPRAREVLAPWLDGCDPEGFVFTADRSEAVRSAERLAARKTPKYPSHMTRNEARRTGQRRTERYTYKALLQGIGRACRKAGVAPFTSYQLRHLRAAEISTTYDLDHAKAVLGHSARAMTDHYASGADDALARRVALGEKKSEGEG